MARTPAVVILILAVVMAPALADVARVYLTDGTVMRGDVRLTDAELVLSNEIGEAQFAWNRVDRIEWAEPAKSDADEFVRRYYALKRDDVEGHFALAEWATSKQLNGETRRACQHVLELKPDHAGAAELLKQVGGSETTAQKGRKTDGSPQRGPGTAPFGISASKPAPPEAPPLLSERDILRLKLSEYELDGPAEPLGVRFIKDRDAYDVEELARRAMTSALDYDPDWDEILTNGQPHERLQIVLKATGLEYVDRIEMRGHPSEFNTYRRRILPMVTRGCLRSGCHGRTDAHVFRFPDGSQKSDEYVYTSFAILDTIQTPGGPMIDRGLPENSALVRYMLPADEQGNGHPPVASERIQPAIRNLLDSRYQIVVDWVTSLRSPHPNYELEYAYPDWLVSLSGRGSAVAPPSVPASRPSTDP